MPGNLGPALKAMLERASIEGLLSVLRNTTDDDEPESSIYESCVGRDHQDARVVLTKALEKQHLELLQPVEDRCVRILQIAEGKGPTSLQTMVGQRLHDEDLAEFEDQNDALERSIWAWIHHHRVFEAAESFHNARKFREYGRMYDAFEVDLDVPVANCADEVDIHGLEAKLNSKLKLRKTCTVVAMDLPATNTHAASVMLIVRAGGLKSSVSHFDDTGSQRQIYFRPPNEATLIWTPSECRMEICSDSPPQREEICNGFAETVLKHDISKKPITWRRYDLSRFRNSLALDIPNIDGFDITMAKVIEAEVRLGTWSRKLALKVAVEDDIVKVAQDHLGPNNVFLRSAAIARVVIAVRFSREGDDAVGTLNLAVSSGNRSNVQSHKDPAVRSLGHALLAAWGILKPFRDMSPEEAWSSLPLLLTLFDFPEDEVTDDVIRDAGHDPDRLINAGMLERAGRQDMVLIDEDDGEVEVRVQPSKAKKLTKIVGEFQESYGLRPSGQFDRYRIRREWLDQKVRELVQSVISKPVLPSNRADLMLLGSVTIDGSVLPVYLARRLYSVKILRQVEEQLRIRQSAGAGVLLSASPNPPVVLGSNVVIDINTLLAAGKIGVSMEDIESAYRPARSLAQSSDVALLRSKGRSGSLIIPGKQPLLVTGDKQMLIVERLVDAYVSGNREVGTKDLLAGTGVRSPKDAWTGQSRKLVADYIESGRRSFWRLAVAGPSAI